MHNSARQRRNEAKARAQLEHPATGSEPPGGSVQAFAAKATGKTPRKANGADDPAETPEPISRAAPLFRLGDDLPQDWRQTPDGIDLAGTTLGMARIPFEADQDYAQRIEQRIALDRGGST